MTWAAVGGVAYAAACACMYGVYVVGGRLDSRE